MSCSKIDSKEKSLEFLSKFDTFLFDCDGVLWEGSKVFPLIQEFFLLLRSQNKHILLVTNNSTSSRKSYAEKVDKMGLRVSCDEIFPSSYAAAFYLKEIAKLPDQSKVYVVGQAGIEDELKEHGFIPLGGTSDNSPITNVAEIVHSKLEDNVKAVVVGYDIFINYRKLSKAFMYLTNDSNCLFVATNTDKTFPYPDCILPGAGSIVGSLQASIEKIPIVTGKPSKILMECIIQKCKLNPSRTCMVGDRLDTDISFGLAHDLATLLVMSGVTTREILDKSNIRPHYICESITRLFEFLSK